MGENALLKIPSGPVEASRAMGAIPMHIIRKVLLPEALPVSLTPRSLHHTLVGYCAMGAGRPGQIGIQYGYIGYNAIVRIPY
ncbi:MAG: D-methionine transport system permease protein MetI [Sodalis sp.]|nr:MAG: D-methionine transport system permease protein MetI [Sodalis sp.]